jgi:hypothetical protein
MDRGASYSFSYARVFITCVFGQPEILDFWGLDGRHLGPENTFKKVVGFAPTFLNAFQGPRGRPDFKDAPQKPGQTAFRYPEISRFVIFPHTSFKTSCPIEASRTKELFHYATL